MATAFVPLFVALQAAGVNMDGIVPSSTEAMSPELGFACPLCVKRKSFKRFHNSKNHLQTVHGFDTT